MVTIKRLVLSQWKGNARGQKFYTEFMNVYNKLDHSTIGDSHVRDLWYFELRNATGPGGMELLLHEYKKTAVAKRKLTQLLTVFQQWLQEKEEIRNNDLALKTGSPDAEGFGYTGRNRRRQRRVNEVRKEDSQQSPGYIPPSPHTNWIQRLQNDTSSTIFIICSPQFFVKN